MIYKHTLQTYKNLIKKTHDKCFVTKIGENTVLVEGKT